MDVEAHVTGVEPNGGIGVRGSVVEQVDGSFGSGFGAFGLSGCKAAKGNKHGVVNGSAIIEKHADDFLETGDFGGIEWGGEVGWGSQLDGGSIDRFGEWGWGMLGAGWWWGFEALEGFGNIARHGEVNCAIDIVPMEGDATVEVALPVGGHLVFGCDDASEVFSMFPSDILYSKVIDDE